MSVANMAIDLSIKHSSSSESSTSGNAVKILPNLKKQQQESSEDEILADIHRDPSTVRYIKQDSAIKIKRMNEVLPAMQQDHQEQDLSSKNSNLENDMKILLYNNLHEQQQESSCDESGSDTAMKILPDTHQEQFTAIYLKQESSVNIKKSNTVLPAMPQQQEKDSLPKDSILDNPIKTSPHHTNLHDQQQESSCDESSSDSAMKILPDIHQEQSTAKYLKPDSSIKIKKSNKVLSAMPQEHQEKDPLSNASILKNPLNTLPYHTNLHEQQQESSYDESSSDSAMKILPDIHKKKSTVKYLKQNSSKKMKKSNKAIPGKEQDSLSEDSILENAMKILPYIHQQQSTAYLKPRWAKDTSDKKIYSCPYEGCKSVFDRPHRLQQHQHLHMNIRPFKCPEEKCMKSYTSKSHLDRHIKCVHKMKTDCNTVIYSCPACMKTYVNRQNLKRHIFKEHINTLNAFFCDICTKKFKNKNQLTAHMYQHTGVKAYKCDYCPLDFVSLYEKKKHTRNHKTYECDTCYEKFYRWSLYLKHKRIDHGSDEYICHDCGKVFKKRYHILQHVKIHLQGIARSFQCPFDNCTRSYSRNSNLTQHIKVKHERISFTCTMCGATLCSKATLQKHIINMHSGKEKKKRTPKTLETGRKVRKDKNVVKKISALKLSGLPAKPEAERKPETERKPQTERKSEPERNPEPEPKPDTTQAVPDFQLVTVKVEPADPDAKDPFSTNDEESFPIDHEIFPTKYFHV